MNFGIFHRRSALKWADKPAVIFGERQLTFAQLEKRSNQVARALAGLGLTKRGSSRNCFGEPAGNHRN